MQAEGAGGGGEMYCFLCHYIPNVLAERTPLGTQPHVVLTEVPVTLQQGLIGIYS